MPAMCHGDVSADTFCVVGGARVFHRDSPCDSLGGFVSRLLDKKLKACKNVEHT